MKKLRKIAVGFGKLVFSGMVSLLLCSAFVFVYSYSGPKMPTETGATDYKWQSYQRKFTMAEGFTYLKMDENGFNNAYEPVGDNEDILLVGSSHMDAANVGATENTGYLLNMKLPEYTYNIGMSAHKIYSCVKNMKAIVDTYEPTEYVILETDRVELSVSDMQEVIDGAYGLTAEPNSRLVYLIKKTVLAVVPIRAALINWKNEGIEENEETEQLYDETYEATLNAFLAKAATPVADSGAKLIIFYQPPTAIDEDGNYLDSTDLEAKALFQDACEENGILFVDMTEPFEELYNEQHRLAHGFINTGVGLGHLNKYGHEVIADKLVDVIRTDKMEGENSVAQ